MRKVFGKGIGYTRAVLDAYSTVSLSSLRWRASASQGGYEQLLKLMVGQLRL